MRITTYICVINKSKITNVTMSNRRIRQLANMLPNYPKTDNTKGQIQHTNFEIVSGDDLLKDELYLSKIGMNDEKKLATIVPYAKYRKYDLTSVVWCNHFENIRKIVLALKLANMEYHYDVNQYIINVLQYNNMIDVSNIKTDDEFIAMLEARPFIKSIFELAKTI